MTLSDEELTNIFYQLDTDKSGLVDRKEIRVMVEKIVNQHRDKLGSEANIQAQIEFLMGKFDVNQDGQITLKEFIEAYRGAKR
ncbi:DgyrCDS7231 [Dimorphilus gyrociliatus]|uniref:DgyrCDS7231 n=1 Tax=Dimorphilus gyrociliatus TaxID=2664684 RepID=A0A7I8VQH8_9ANNE|nr:DgyrCDS7231 [Dimorphilus gyrociliatus]